ncbi:MAG TPA: PaaI family thioesterase [Candidatus Baltobacteraceae bacterium]|jgi:uncharacterized protein (TIGR00369 family)|nr:PaaI family thioesterase [Candidatus Baltobacteraceae bacterium]
MRERTFRWTDPRELSRLAFDQNGLEWLHKMKTGELPPPPIVEALSFVPEELEEGRIVFSMRAEEWMCNPASVVHGGMAATLLDTVLTLAVVSKLPKGRTAQTIQMNVNYVRPLLPTGEKVTGEGFAVHVGTTIGTAEGRVYDARGKIIAHGSATLAILETETMREARLPNP